MSVFYLNVTVLNIFISFHYLQHIYVLAAPFKKDRQKMLVVLCWKKHIWKV